MTIHDLKPALVFDIFHQITQVPRPSKKEAKIRQFLLDFAAKHGLEVQQDEILNITMRKPGTPGHENAPCTTLQAHMDMVCESDNKDFDFDNSPIETIVDGEWLRANGTTLGADNGIGMALALAAMIDDSYEHGPIECLFTVDEEQGLTGASHLGEGMITGDYLVNLDTEDDAEIYVGCAGGIDTVCEFSYTPEAPKAGYQFFKLDISNGLGGHSGSDINQDRMNANQTLARFLCGLDEFQLAEIDGGNLRNAIPRAAYAIFGVPAGQKEAVSVAFNVYYSEVKNEYATTDPNVELKLETVEAPAVCVESAVARKLVLALYGALHGVQAMSAAIPGLVETSTNLASVKMQGDNKIVVTTSQRSSVESAKFSTARRVGAIFALAGATVKHGEGYCGWQPVMSSKLLHIASDAYEELYGIKPAVKAIHAGLECGLFKGLRPEMDVISIGPTLRDVHSPSERMHIPAVEHAWEHVKLMLTKIANL